MGSNLNVFMCFYISMFTVTSLAKDICKPYPRDSSFVRVGDTRFYIHHNENRESRYYHSFEEAHNLCRKHNMRVPIIDDLTTFASVARPLEKYVFEEKLRDTWYWLDAQWNETAQKYFWMNTSMEVKYGNYFQRYPRPIGVGAHTSFLEQYQRDRNATQCLALALPWPNNYVNSNNLYGHSASIDERACEAKQHKHAMCESVYDECNSKPSSNFVLTEDKSSYFKEGNWIIGNRSFIITWDHMNHENGKAYCEKMGLQLYNPNRETDSCLIPFIKMWSRNVTHSLWWTGWTYQVTGKTYFDAQGDLVARLDTEDKDKPIRLQWKSTKLKDKFCVAMSHEYEFRGQFPCPDPDNKDICRWHFADFVPANCENYHGVICQHQDRINRTCLFDKNYTNNIQDALNMTATTPFAWDENEELLRSRYKQVFGSLICPKNYRMHRINNTAAWKKPTDLQKLPYLYDLKNSYWVIDEESFAKNETSLCTLSVPSIKDPWERIPTKRPCYEWHFYLCERKTNLKPQKLKPDAPNMQWNEKEYRRKYPHTNN